MDIKGLFLCGPADGDNLYLYLCTLDLNVFSADTLDLIASKGAVIEGVQDIVDLLAEAAPEIITAIEDVEGHLMGVQANSAKMPSVITDPSYLSYADFPTPVYVQRTGVYKLRYIEFSPVFRLINQSTLWQADLAYCGYLKAYYVKSGAVTHYTPTVPSDALPYVVGGLRGLYPTDTWGAYDDEIIAAYSHYGLNQYYGAIDYINTWYEGGTVEYWHMLSGQGIVIAEVVNTQQGIIMRLASSTQAAFNADYPANVLVGWERVWNYQSAKIRRVVDEDDRWVRPLEPGVVLPCVQSGIGGVLGGVLGLAVQTTLLSSVWRTRKNA